MSAKTVIDLRSDTVTKPTTEMRRAMAEAEVGDDVHGEDPTVNRLEEASAKRVGKEAGLFVPTGTMANQIATWVHTGRQGAVLLEANSHLLFYELGGAAMLSNVLLRGIEGENGVIRPEQLEPYFDDDVLHTPRVRMIEIENTHNRAGGTVWTPAQTRAIGEFGKQRGIPTHIDGARIFNAAVAQDIDVKALTRDVDSVMFCFSKGLSAPVGSVLCGTRKFIDEARIARKVLGGGMRQAGVIAAPALVGLEKMVDRLREDHENARRLGASLAKIDGIKVDMQTVQTNMVMCDIEKTGLTPNEFCKRLAARGVLAAPRDVGPVVRFVTHREISRADIDVAVDSVTAIVKRPDASPGPHERSKTSNKSRKG